MCNMLKWKKQTASNSGSKLNQQETNKIQFDMGSQ